MSDLNPTAGAANSSPIQDELVAFWRAIWLDRWLFCLIVAVFTALAITFALLAEERFKSEAILIAASPKSTSGLSGQLGNLGGLVGLAGLSLLGGGNTSEPIAVLKSRDLAREFILDNKLLPVIFSKRWDAAEGRWKDPRPEKQPDVRDAVRYFQKNILTVQEDKKNGLIILDVEWTDAKQAADWANQLIERINAIMRERALVESDANIEYLQSQLSSNTPASLQQAVGRLLENEMQKAMLARGSKEFAFRVVDKPEVPKRRSFPDRTLTATLGFLLGGIVGVVVVFVRRAFRQSAALSARTSDT